MSWQVRHEGSPNATPNLTGNQVLQGVAEGVWEPSDEVRGPGETTWQSLESHPFFAEAVSEIELPEKGHHDDESHLDMNPLIDVALVLLIFFIVTASYDALKKVIPMPSVSGKSGGAPRVVEAGQLSDIIRVKAFTKSGEKIVTYVVDGTEYKEENLLQAIQIGKSQKKNKLLMELQDVRWDTVVKIMDAAKGAHIDKVMMRVDEVKK